MLGAPAFPTFTDAYTAVLGHVTQHPEHVISARGNHAGECLNVSFTLTDPRERIVWSPVRRPNIVFSYAEVLWHLLGRDDVAMIGYYAPGIRRYSADGTRLPGTAYGRKLFGMHGDGERGQWDRVRSLVTDDPSSKRAVLAIFDPAELAERANPDVSCALALHLLLRDGMLHAVTYMRANDAMIGLLCDVFAFSLIQEFLARQLGASLGTYTHHVASMHVNHPDASWATRIVASQHENMRFPSATLPPTTWDDIRAIGQLEEALRRNVHRLDPSGLSATRLAPYWQQVALLFEAYRQITHDGRTVSTATMHALDPGHRHLVAWRWPESVPAGFLAPSAGPR
jgi:thymidylate synthase